MNEDCLRSFHASLSTSDLILVSQAGDPRKPTRKPAFSVLRVELVIDGWREADELQYESMKRE